MLGQLIPCGGGPPIMLHKPHLVVGRDLACDVPIRLPTISSRHCELDFRDGYWFVRDLKSSNGTRVNGKPCSSQEPLLPNDELWIAGFRFQITYKAPADKPSAKAPAPKAAQPLPTPAPRVSTGTRSLLGELVPCGGGRPIALLKMRVLVGRHPKCDVVLAHSTVSARHCQLDLVKGSWQVRDLASRNGIRINGMRCEEGALPPESILWIATHRYRVVYEGPGGVTGPDQASVFGQSLLERAGLTGWQPRGDDDDTDPHRPSLEDL
jgi:pSer/pThr/pTyr-binding forkhead associated (FHA) protein